MKMLNGWEGRWGEYGRDRGLGLGCGESVTDGGPKDNDSVFLTTHVLKNYMKDKRRVEEPSVQ